MAQIVDYNGTKIEFPDGMSPGDIESAIKASAMDLPGSVSAGRALNDIPRQIGLTGRYALEGLANTAQVFTEPLRYLTDKFLPDRGGVSNLVTGQAAPPKSTPLGIQATKLADAIGLPSPQTANERTVGEGARMLAGGAGLAGAANAGARALATPVSSFLARGVPEVAGAVTNPSLAQSGTETALRALGSNLPAQLGGAAGAGVAGGASKEAGGGGMQQAGAAMLGGVAGSMAPAAIGRTSAAIGNAAKALTGRQLTDQQLDVQISGLLQRAGRDFSELPDNVRRSLRAELADTLRAGREVNPEAVSRLADFRTVGATPTRGMISLDPVQITREQNLAKIAANTKGGELDGLPLLQNRNNAAVIGRLNDVGASRGVDALQAGRLISDRITGTNSALGAVEQGAWNFAKGSPGYKQPIYPDGLNAALKATGEDALTGYLPKQITDYMAAFQSGQQPFTPQHYKNLRSMLSGELAKGGNEAAAARAAIRGLDSVPITPITNPRGVDLGSAPVTQQLAGALRGLDEQAGSSVAAVDRARAATAAKYRYQESSPLVRQALGDARTAAPEKLAESFVLRGTLQDAQSVAREVGPEGLGVMRDAIANQIKQKALSGAADETGKVSQSALNRAINSVGAEKLALFFSPAEVQQLRATGRVASLMQAQPAGSAVNNSNTAGALIGRALDFAKKVPGGQQFIVDPAQNLQVSIQSRQAQNLTPGLLATQPQAPLGANPLLLPGLALTGGLLSQ